MAGVITLVRPADQIEIDAHCQPWVVECFGEHPFERGALRRFRWSYHRTEAEAKTRAEQLRNVHAETRAGRG